jgi:hypothetical protein
MEMTSKRNHRSACASLSVCCESLLTHEASWVVVVGADLSVNLDKTLSDDEGDLTSGQSVLELVLKEDLFEQITLVSPVHFCPASWLLSSLPKEVGTP